MHKYSLMKFLLLESLSAFQEVPINTVSQDTFYTWL